MSKIDRRGFLTGIGATALAATLGGRAWRARAQSTTGKRFVFVLSGNGYDANITMSDATKAWIADSRGYAVSDDWWWGSGYSEGYYAEDRTEPYVLSGALSGAPGLRAFEAEGLLDQCAMIYGLSSMVTGGGHSAGHGVLASARTIAGRPGGETIDHYLARLEGVRGVGDGRAPLSAIRIGAGSGRGGIGYGMCAAGRGAAVPVLYSPTSVWNAYIRPFVDSAGLEALEYRRRLLEFAQADAVRAQDELGGRGAQAAAMAAAAGGQLDDLAILRERTETWGGRLSLAPAAPPEVMTPAELKQFQLDVVAAAMQADLTRVAVVSLGAGNGGWSFPYELGPVTTADSSHGTLYHPYSGAGESSGEADEKRQRRSELREAWSQELDAVASLAAKLRDLPEPGGDGSMLDHTVITYVADNGVGHHASARDYPLLIVGGGSLGVATGNRALFYPDVRTGEGGRRELVNLWSTYGITLAEGPAGRDGSLAGFGDPGARLAGGILPELMG
ncbi:MAG: DUF1552 domain-containing protein [Deltaproteobacteria bacterium]|nr:DUF1552 domain-containing protein [Deltaproteobacteria bacterium]